MNLTKKEARVSLSLLALIGLVAIVILIVGTNAENSLSYNSTNLAIYDGSDSLEKYTQCTNYCTEKGKPAMNRWDIYFYANYTNASYFPLNYSNENGNCSIRFNETGSLTEWLAMSYNSSSLLWQYNRSFNYKGNLRFETNCTSDSGSINLSDGILIKNTVPYIITTPEGYIDFNYDGSKDILSCSEDTLCYYNFSANVSDDDLNDILIFNYSTATNTTLTNFTFDSSASMLRINITRDENAGSKRIELTVADSESTTRSAILEINISPVNDAPVFVNLENRTFNISELSRYIINITDEENNIPFVINISFMNCSYAQWSDRTNCTLFTTSQYTFNDTFGILNLSFTPLRNDVGWYIINFSVMDNSSLGNKTTSKIVNFTIINLNSAPYFTYLCDDNRNATEDSEFTCWINASDIDETLNLTFSANFSWFTFNSSGSNFVSVTCNASTGYNSSVLVNFTPRDLQVGNWSINITLTDIGSGLGAPKSNSTIIPFFINNVEDNVTLALIGDQSIYENKTFYVNAIDNDLLVPDHSVKNEVLTFASNAGWVAVSTSSISGNTTAAKIDIDYNSIFVQQGSGDYIVRINVTDTSGNYAERNFTISILGDSPAQWNSTMSNTFVLYENNLTYINLSLNVSDADADDIDFSYFIDGIFPNFNLTFETGIINFTPGDADVGYYNIIVNASDGKLNSLKSFNFTVYNVIDAPYIEDPLQQSNVINASVGSGSNIICDEDNYTLISFWVQDDDFKITQKSFYDEFLRININITGPNITLLNFSKDPAFPTSGSNRSRYEAVFKPKKSDVGTYNVLINITDSGGASDILLFNLTVSPIEHNPSLTNISNLTSAINRTFYYRINATDEENGNSTIPGNYNFTFSYSFTEGNNLFNSTIFNSTTGEINITFNSSQGGKYKINIVVNDSGNRQDSEDFWIYVYDVPNIIFPLAGYSYNLTENLTANLTFSANNSIGDNLTYQIYIFGSNSTFDLRYNISYYCNTNLTWNFAPNFSDESYGVNKNMILVVFNSLFPDVNTSRTLALNISHSNSPVVFSGNLGDYQSDYDNHILINLSSIFSDIDNWDSYYNQSLSFNISSNASPSYIIWSVSGFTLNLSSLIEVTELLSISARDLDNNNTPLTYATSNNFRVQFTTPSQVSVPAPSSGGTATIPVAFKIIAPNRLSVYAYQKIDIPLKLSNKGKKSFNYLNISSSAFKDGNAASKVRTSLDKSFFASLDSGDEKNMTLTVYFDTNISGDYEIFVNATSKTPKYNDWAKIQVSLQKTNESDVDERLVFTEELIAENPECIELKELLDEAKEDYKRGDVETAMLKSEKIIAECRDSVSQTSLPSLKLSPPFTVNEYAIIASLIAIFVGISYYSIKRTIFNKKLGISSNLGAEKDSSTAKH
jgi:hypothetical protein